MLTIASLTDIESYVTDSHPDAVEHGFAGDLVSAIQDADHPDYGDDWSEWLNANAGDLLLEIASRGDASDLDNQEVSLSAARAWARDADAGDYLIEYEDAPRGSDPGSMCGFGADEIAEINEILGRRDLTLTADDRGLVAEVESED